MLRPISPTLKKIQSQPHWSGYKLLERIQSLWPDVVGEVVSQNTQPIRIQQQILQVATSTSTWAQNLVFQRKLILSKLNPQLAKPLVDLRFLAGEWYRDRPDAVSVSIAFAERQANSFSPAPTPEEAFTRWVEKVKESHSSCPRCPVCGSPTPRVELDRWRKCCFCQMQNRNF